MTHLRSAAVALIAAAVLATSCVSGTPVQQVERAAPANQVLQGELVAAEPDPAVVEEEPVPESETEAETAVAAEPEPTPEPTAVPEPTATPEPAPSPTPEPEPEPASLETADGLAPVYALATGNCETEWDDGIVVTVYTRNNDDIARVTTTALGALIVLATQTVPSADAWRKLQDDMGAANIEVPVTADDITTSALALTIFGFDGPEEIEYRALISELKNIPSVLLITTTRCEP